MHLLKKGYNGTIHVVNGTLWDFTRFLFPLESFNLMDICYPYNTYSPVLAIMSVNLFCHSWQLLPTE